MKKITFLLAALVVMSLNFLQAQTSPDYILGSLSPWSWTAGTVGTQVSTGVYQWKFTAAATGDVFFKFGETAAVTDGSGFWVNGSGSDMTYSGAGAMWDTYYQANSASGGAVKFTATTGYSYVVQSRKALANTNANFAVFESPTAIATITTVAQAFAAGNLTVTITPSSVPDAVQKFWVRYTNDSWTTSQFVEAPVSAGVASVVIPLASGDKIEYYAFTTVQAPVGFTDYDFFAVSINNNTGKNYRFMEPLSGDYYIPNTGVQKGFKLLSEAVSYINVAGIAGNTNLLITADMTEPANIGLGVNTNGFGITIRPDLDADRTITFTQLTDNTSPTGHLVIGYPSAGLPVAWTISNTIATSNVTIDGYAVGGTTKRLKFTNANTTFGSRVIVVVGACQNTTIKNCIIVNTTTNASSPFALGAVVRKVGTVATDAELAPNGLIFDNNTITCNTSTVGMGIRITNSNTPLTATVAGFVCKNNIISAQRRILEMNYTNGGQIYGNTISLVQPTSTALGYGIWTATGCAGTFNIYNNKFIAVSCSGSDTAAGGQRALSLGGSVTCNVYNNMFAGMNRAGTATGAVNQTYCFFGCTGKIYNNTFYMPALTVKTNTGYYTAIQLSTSNPDIKNNIFISNEDGMINAFYSAVTTGTSDYNIFYNRAGNTKSLFVSGTATSTFAAYQTANPTKDINSKNVDVNFTSATDLSLAGTSIQDNNLSVPRISTVLNDMNGVLRSDPTYAGAMESTLPFIVTFIDNNVEQTARIMRTVSGIQVELDGEATVELYTMNGVMIDKTVTSGTYSHDLNNGIYIVRVNGKATKFVK